MQNRNYLAQERENLVLDRLKTNNHLSLVNTTMTPEEIQAVYRRITEENCQELAQLLQSWFDKHQPEAKRDFVGLVGNDSSRKDCGDICGHAVDWFYFGN